MNTQSARLETQIRADFLCQNTIKGLGKNFRSMGFGRKAVLADTRAPHYIGRAGSIANRTTLTGAIIVILALFLSSCDLKPALAETFKITAYDSCFACCGKTDGITASGKPARIGTVACNWLKFGTKVKIGETTYTVQDRGARSQFGTFKHPKKHLDIWLPTHKEARRFGVQYKDVQILKGDDTL